MTLTSSVVINTCCGGFGLSEAAQSRLGEDYPWYKPRNALSLVNVVREMGEAANGSCAKLKIVDLPPGKYIISDYDGSESICQYHRVFRNGRWVEEGIVVNVPNKGAHARSHEKPNDRLARLRKEVEVARLEAELRELRAR